MLKRLARLIWALSLAGGLLACADGELQEISEDTPSRSAPREYGASYSTPVVVQQSSAVAGEAGSPNYRITFRMGFSVPNGLMR